VLFDPISVGASKLGALTNESAVAESPVLEIENFA
jgi:hypothetical protein